MDSLDTTPLPLDSVKFTERKTPCSPFKEQGKSQHNIVNQKTGYLLGVLKMLDSFINGNTAPKGKNENGNHETPKIDFFAMTEWKVFIGWFFRLLQTIKQKHLIAGIDQGMDRFRKHGRAVGNESCTKLRDCNECVADEGCNNNFF